jgi:hypothetical protein
MSDPLIRKLGELPAAEPDVTRTEHIRTRCHARLERQKPRSLVASTPTAGRMAPVWQLAIGVLGFVYLTEVIRFALAVVWRA